MRQCIAAAWGEYQELRDAGVYYTPSVPVGMAQLLDELYVEAELDGFPSAMELLNGPLWLIQAVAETANMLAKKVSEAFYAVKDWLLREITGLYMGCTGLYIRSSWGMAELEIRTAEWGVSSFHTYQHMDAWYDLPHAGEWCGIRRQFNAVQLLKDEQLRGWVARVTLKAKDGRLPVGAHERINNLLDGWGEVYPLP